MSAESGRIFLSHKSVDKAVVRDYKQTLELLGLKPWLDEDDLPAGVELHRALQKGMKESCAAVFFVTPSYRDDKHIRNEINYAIAEKTQRGDDFSIITLVMTDATGVVGPIPELLEPYVWKQPASLLQGLREVIRGLPGPFRDIRPIPPTTVDPKVRVTIDGGKVVYQGNVFPNERVVMVKLQNHGTGPVFISSGISFELDDSPDFLWTAYDYNHVLLVKKVVAPGDSYTVALARSWLAEHAAHIKSAFFVDEIGRFFKTGETETRKVLRDE